MFKALLPGQLKRGKKKSRELAQNSPMGEPDKQGQGHDKRLEATRFMVAVGSLSGLRCPA